MPALIRIDFVSDVSCPWCAIGLSALEQAIANIGDEAQVAIEFQPFELNPDMAPEGEDITEHLSRKYGASPEQLAQTREMIRQRGAELGFTFTPGKRDRIYNTFDAHRLLHWAAEEGLQLPLKRALFTAYFTDGESPANHDVLLRVADEVGLNPERAREILASDDYADAVRAQEQFFLRNGINSVPAVIVNEQYLIQGGQPVEAFEQALRKIAALD
ncbi:DsbA family oxidoreductase [Chitinimonas sp. BJYL2]|uniref:DsbA family oxidoreductase n=1 Tax=Chitinimonas sp. BJYL2 TaxID=2976696 RepID=UPI0022B33E2E|nr:DsbA family oxidoreductase [Chitinimonas sp. BJYL2]